MDSFAREMMIKLRQEVPAGSRIVDIKVWYDAQDFLNNTVSVTIYYITPEDIQKQIDILNL